VDVQKILLLAVLSGNNPFKKKDSDLCAYLSVSRGGGHEQLISNGGRFKPAFAERLKEINANRFFGDSHWLKIWSNHFCPSMGPNGGSVAMDSEGIQTFFANITLKLQQYNLATINLHYLVSLLLQIM
jgi:hypothetical protein